MRRVIWSSLLAGTFWGAGADAGAAARYDGDRVVRIETTDEAQLATVLELTDDVWSHHVGVGEIDIRVTPAQYAALTALGLPHEVLIGDVQELIDAERTSVEAGGAGPFDDYLPFDEVQSYLDGLVALRPDLASIVTIGQSLEFRPLRGIRITGPGGGDKPMIFYHGGIHAREWITVPTTMYVADQLIRNYDTNPVLRELVDRCEWIILPVVNPDGYVYTWDFQRLWRKNRRGNGFDVWGVDLNRNFGYQWGGSGSSGSTSSETYRGPAPFSEPETQAIRDFITANPRIVAYNDIHCYSQLILWPWGYTETLSPDEPEFARIGHAMEALIEDVHGTPYTAGAIGPTLYLASGGSADWAYGDRGILAFSYELRDTGAFGFVLPANQIMPTCEETFPALMYYADEMSAPVRIAFPNGLPTIAAPGTTTPIDVEVRNNAQIVDPASVTLYARAAPGDAFTAYPLLAAGGDLYLGSLPAGDCGAPLEYYVTAAGLGGGTITRPAGAPADVFTTAIGTVVEAARDEFESDQGWSVVNDPSLTSGGWVRADPVGTGTASTPVQPEDDYTPGAGTQCYVTQNGSPGGAAGSSDVDGGPTILTSPLYDLSTMTDPRLRYARWYASSGDDVLVVQISTDDGQSWQPLETVASIRAWEVVEFRVFDVAPGATSIRIRFIADDTPNNSVVDAAVDDVIIDDVTCVSSALIGDLNCDGAVTVGDIAGFVLALTDPAGYAAQFPDCDIDNADVNDDSAVTVSDIGGFVALLTGP